MQEPTNVSSHSLPSDAMEKQEEQEVATAPCQKAKHIANQITTNDATAVDGIAINPLGIVFDIDGTLIAEGERVIGIKIRPGVVEFLKWCKDRGHVLALWTKAHSSWASHVMTKLCQAVHPDHKCRHGQGCCKRTFEFCWDSKKLTNQKLPFRWWQPEKGDYDKALYSACRWCEVYRNVCHQCECAWDKQYCPCRQVKDLRKVWSSSTLLQCYSCETPNKVGPALVNFSNNPFVRERTLIIEDTPQNCRFNYGNAIYEPKYKGGLYSDETFSKLRTYVETTLEPSEDVRKIRKCDHHPIGYHACFNQSWWGCTKTEIE